MSKEIINVMDKLSIFLSEEDTFTIKPFETKYKNYTQNGDQVFFVYDSENTPIYVVKLLRNVTSVRQDFLENIFNLFNYQDLLVVPIRSKLTGSFLYQESDIVYMISRYKESTYLSIGDMDIFIPFYKKFRIYADTLSLSDDQDYRKRISYFYERSLKENNQVLEYSRKMVNEYLLCLPNIPIRLIHASIWKNNILCTNSIDPSKVSCNFVDNDSLMVGDPYHEYFQVFCMIAELVEFDRDKLIQQYGPIVGYFRNNPDYKLRFTYIIHFLLLKTLSNEENASSFEKYYLLNSIDCFNSIFLKQNNL